jgi:phage baseplate assembly protein V
MSAYDITELDRRVSNLIRFGTIAEADYALAKVRVRCGDILTGWLPWLTPRAGGNKTWDAPETGEQVVILSPSGELNQGLVFGSLFQALMPAPVATPEKHHTVYIDGAVLEYDRNAHHLSAILPAGATVQLTSSGGITINGNITLTGDITLTGTLTASVDVIGGGKSLKTHKHGGVTAGGAQTGVPV